MNNFTQLGVLMTSAVGAGIAPTVMTVKNHNAHENLKDVNELKTYFDKNLNKMNVKQNKYSDLGTYYHSNEGSLRKDVIKANSSYIELIFMLNNTQSTQLESILKKDNLILGINKTPCEDTMNIYIYSANDKQVFNYDFTKDRIQSWGNHQWKGQIMGNAWDH